MLLNTLGIIFYKANVTSPNIIFFLCVRGHEKKKKSNNMHTFLDI
jgi:hypothetical protein